MVKNNQDSSLPSYHRRVPACGHGFQGKGKQRQMQGPILLRIRAPNHRHDRNNRAISVLRLNGT